MDYQSNCLARAIHVAGGHWSHIGFHASKQCHSAGSSSLGAAPPAAMQLMHGRWGIRDGTSAYLGGVKSGWGGNWGFQWRIDGRHLGDTTSNRPQKLSVRALPDLFPHQGSPATGKHHQSH